MLKYHIINLASCRLCPRRAAGGKERRYMDQNDKNKSNKNNDRRKGRAVAAHLGAGADHRLQLSPLGDGHEEAGGEHLRDPLRRISRPCPRRQGQGGRDRGPHAQHHACGRLHLHRRGRQDLLGDFQLFTTQINDPELRSFLDENGVEFGKPLQGGDLVS